MVVSTVVAPVAYPLPDTFTSTVLLPATGVTSHVIDVADAVCTTHAALPTVTVLSVVVELNPVPVMVSVPGASRVDGLTPLIVGVLAFWKSKEQLASSSGQVNRVTVVVSTPSPTTVSSTFSTTAP